MWIILVLRLMYKAFERGGCIESSMPATTVMHSSYNNTYIGGILFMKNLIETIELYGLGTNNNVTVEELILEPVEVGGEVDMPEYPDETPDDNKQENEDNKDETNKEPNDDDNQNENEDKEENTFLARKWVSFFSFTIYPHSPQFAFRTSILIRWIVFSF